jgi:hypothetical protein
MESNVLVQAPLFNLSRLDFFNLQMRSDNSEWEIFLEEFLHIRYLSFRQSYINKNMEMTIYYLNLLEGNFL